MSSTNTFVKINFQARKWYCTKGMARGGRMGLYMVKTTAIVLKLSYVHNLEHVTNGWKEWSCTTAR